MSSHTACEIYVEVEPQTHHIHNDHDVKQTSLVQFGFDTKSNIMLPTPIRENKKIVVQSEYERMLHDKPSRREGCINRNGDDGRSKCMFCNNSSLDEFSQIKIFSMFFQSNIPESEGVHVDQDTKPESDSDD